LAAAAIAACSVFATAPASAQGVKIGVLADQSGTFADFDGKWSVEAAKMAVEDFGGSSAWREDRADRRRPPEQA
jgi:branched-chain amino acid transport system substrate-binding protein